MSRANVSRFPGKGPAEASAGKPVSVDSAKIAEDIGIAALKLATRAHDAGLTTIAHLLQSVALEAGAEAATRWWSDDVAER